MDLKVQLEAKFGCAVGLPAAEVRKKSVQELCGLLDASSDKAAWDLFDKVSAARGQGPYPAALRFSRLSRADYADCLGLWEGWPPFRGDGLDKQVSPKNEPWRKEFIYRLKNQSAEWHKLVRLGIQRLKEEEREDILWQFIDKDQGNSDPLRYLDLCGVPPFDILSTLQDTEVRRRKIKYIAEAVREYETQTMRALALLKAKLSKSEAISRYSDDTEMKKDLEAFEPKIARYYASIAARVGLKQPGSRTKRRAHAENEFRYVAKLLIAESYSEMTANGRGDYWIKSILPVITCI